MAEDATTALQALAGRYWQFLRHEFPLSAFLAGQPNDDPTLFREAPADVERRASQARRMLAELEAIGEDGLAAQDRITHRLLQRELHDVVQVHATGSHRRPWLLPAGPEFNTIFFANATQLGDVQAARDYVARLASLPGYFADLQACLAEGHARGLRQPRVVLQAALANLKAHLGAAADASPWYGPFVRSPMAAHPALRQEGQRALQQIEHHLVPALGRWAGYLEGVLLPAARDTIACIDGAEDAEGEAFYAHWVRHFTTLPMRPQAIHALGLAEVERLEAAIADVAEQAGFAGDAHAYRRFLRDDPAFCASSGAALLERMRALAKRIDGLVPTVIGRLPRACYGVQSIPAGAAEKMPLAYAQPGPGDGSAAGVFWVSSLPERVPSYLHVCLSLHEAWPGHLMHIGLMQEMDALPMFRRGNFTKYSACLEGWAMYCETLGQELGLYETPHDHFGRLDMEMWRACRLVVDTGIHVHGWSREKAVAYMAQRLTMPRPAIEAEVDRYIAMPAQALGYQLGGLKFRELRQRAQSRLGDRFQLRAFHDQLMAAGAVTLPVLEEVIDDWLQRHAA